MGRSYQIQLSPTSVSLRKWAGSRSVKSPRVTRWISVLKNESQTEKITELPYLTLATSVESQCRPSIKINDSFPPGGKWVKGSERAGAQSKLYSDLDLILMKMSIKGPWAWSRIPLEPWTTEETWIETKAILWPTLSIQIRNKLESLWAHSETLN